MGDLYLIFFGVGALLFVAIVGYSVLQKRRAQPIEKKDYVDPLFAELEQSKSKSAAAQDSAPKSEAAKVITNTASKAATKASEPSNARSVKPKSASTKTQTEPPTSRLAPSMDVESNEADPQDTSAESEKQAPSLDQARSTSSPTNKSDATQTRSATVHQADTAPKPRLDKDSSSVVTELVARIKNPEAIEQQGLLGLFRKHDFKFHRKVNIYGLNQLTDMWRDIEFELPSARFTELGVSIQLADRDGAMSQKELHDFQQMVLEFTNVYDAPFEFSMEIDEALKQALALDQIGRRYDSMAVLNVVPKTKAGFRMADIESCARDLMMSTDKNGIFMKTIGSKNNISVLFRLACTDGSGQFGISSGASTPVHDLVVYMNVPATKDPEMVFQEMVRDANSLATWLEGKVVDRNGRVMTQRSYSMLMQQVSDIAFSMQQDGFTPGDAVAMKLF